MKKLAFLMLGLPVLSTQAATITVSAQKVLKPSKNITNPISVITSSDIENSPYTDLKDIIQSHSGVYVSSNGTFGGAATLRIRGNARGYSKVIIDGIELTDPSDIDKAFQINFLDLSNIERIEILKGAQSVIYGSESIGGIINIVTKKSSKKQLSSSLTLGSHETKNFSINTSGKKDDINYSFGASYFSTDGISSFNSKKVDGPAEKDSYRRLNIKSNVTKTINEKHSVSYQLIAIKSDLELDDFGVDRKDDDNSSYDQEIHNISLDSKLFQRLESKLSIESMNVDRRSRSKFPSEYESSQKKISWLGNYFHSKDMATSLGLNYSKEKMTKNTGFNDFQNKSIDNKDLSISSNIKKGKIFSDLGARVDDHKIFGTHVTYKLGLGIHLLKGLSLKGSSSTGFKAPTLTQTFYSGSKVTLDPTESKNYDLTLNYNNNWLVTELSVFRYNYSNQIDFDQSANKYLNVGRSRIYGLEGRIDLRANKTLALNNSITMLRSLNKVTGKELGKTPRLSVKSQIQLKYRKMTIFNDWIYVGNRQDSGRMPSYLVSNLNLSYSNFKFSILNLLDRDYEDTRTYGTPGRSFYLGYKLEI